MESYRLDLERKQNQLKQEYNQLIDELEENPTPKLVKECSLKYIELLTVKSRIRNLGKEVLPETVLPQFIN